MTSILVVDDEKMLLTMFYQILTKFGYDVQVAESAEEGIAKFDSGDFALVITDIVMNGKDGNEVAQHIRGSQRSYTPIIAISGTPRMARKEIFDSVLKKPFSIDILMDSVKNFTDTQAQSAERAG